MTALAKDNLADWHKYLPAICFAYRSSVVWGMGYSPFYLMHGREPVLPGQLMASSDRRLPVDSDAFVENLKDRLEAAFAAVVRNDTDTKEARILKSSCLPDERSR